MDGVEERMSISCSPKEITLYLSSVSRSFPPLGEQSHGSDKGAAPPNTDGEACVCACVQGVDPGSHGSELL